jgi:hypothetical protein
MSPDVLKTVSSGVTVETTGPPPSSPQSVSHTGGSATAAVAAVSAMAIVSGSERSRTVAKRVISAL